MRLNGEATGSTPSEIKEDAHKRATAFFGSGNYTLEIGTVLEYTDAYTGTVYHYFADFTAEELIP